MLLYAIVNGSSNTKILLIFTSILSHPVVPITVKIVLDMSTKQIYWIEFMNDWILKNVLTKQIFSNEFMNDQ